VPHTSVRQPQAERGDLCWIHSKLRIYARLLDWYNGVPDVKGFGEVPRMYPIPMVFERVWHVIIHSSWNR